LLRMSLVGEPETRLMSSPPHQKGLRLAWLALALGLIVYMIVLPAVDAARKRLQPQPSVRVLEDLSFGEQVRLRSAEAFTATWFFALGATIGSFLNVVVHRLPRRESLVLQRSHCPVCGGPIAGRDNVPILSYFLLGGRCRTCRTSISLRYPLVELSTAVLFLLLYWVQLISGGANLPVREPNYYRGVVWIVFYTKWDLVGLYLYHCYLFCVLFSWALIQGDRNRVPWRSQLVALSIGIVPPLIWPHLLLVPLQQPLPAALAASPRLASLAAIAAGCICGLVVGGWLRYSRSRPSCAAETATADDPLGGCVLLGSGLGWQAVLSVAVFAFALKCLAAFGSRWIPRGRHISMLGFLFAAAVLYQIFWRTGVHHAGPWWLGPGSGIVHLLVPVGCLVFLALLARRGRWPEPDAPAEETEGEFGGAPPTADRRDEDSDPMHQPSDSGFTDPVPRTS
jgi:leader peptidase (prepilin peptidase) / N-methyltransferase